MHTIPTLWLTVEFLSGCVARWVFGRAVEKHVEALNLETAGLLLILAHPAAEQTHAGLQGAPHLCHRWGDRPEPESKGEK